MGFGSYDESEQHRGEQQTDDEDEEAVSRDDADYEGSIEFETGSTDDLLDKLDDIKDGEDDQ